MISAILFAAAFAAPAPGKAPCPDKGAAGYDGASNKISAMIALQEIFGKSATEIFPLITQGVSELKQSLADADPAFEVSVISTTCSRSS